MLEIRNVRVICSLLDRHGHGLAREWVLQQTGPVTARASQHGPRYVLSIEHLPVDHPECDRLPASLLVDHPGHQGGTLVLDGQVAEQLVQEQFSA